MCESPQPALLRAKEVAALLQVRQTKVYDLAAKELIPTVRVGTAIRFPRVKLYRQFGIDPRPITDDDLEMQSWTT